MPAAIIGSLKPYGVPDGLDPREWRIAVQRRVNELLDQSMALITALDVMEADSEDLEDGADAEPSLGWTARGGQSFLAGTAPNGSPCDTIDLELDNCDDEDGHDAEEDNTDLDHLTWETDQSQEVLVSL
ncbi:hypothetical protein P9228_18470 [Mesorhizobium sp. WSM4898]|uniref:hypothetical protein n=1 Tax=Mesorhizobium sp. WSM4898 TaxID=3038544 RepID=UPI002415854E|nr:hypothetical protein [Mesorhizobium sp. WSM4898]MDG4908414.1 hypothetical protein [Mesorhizobium sp. WSM4898]